MGSKSPFSLPSLANRLAHTAWQEEAACIGADSALFFPKMGETYRHGMAYCQRCPVRKECLEYSIETEQWYGLWGGVKQETRRRMIELRQRKYVLTQEADGEGSSLT